MLVKCFSKSILTFVLSEMKTVTLFLLLGLVLGDQWAVLMACGKGFYRYNHHADVSHTYQMLRRGGIPADHIITFLRGDPIFDERNPFTGELFHKPGLDPPNVFQGVVADYWGESVTVENFIFALKGDERAGGKILRSNADDNVLIFTVSMGAPYTIRFETGNDLHANLFVETIQKMHDNMMYKNLVIFTESGYAGSIMKNLPTDIHAYAFSATNDQMGSEWTHCVNCYVRNTYMDFCLADLFSLRWIEYLDVPEQRDTTLDALYNYLATNITVQPVLRYGDMSIKNMSMTEFIGNYTGWNMLTIPRLTEKPLTDYVQVQPIVMSSTCVQQYSNDVRMQALCTRAQSSTGATKQKLQKELSDEVASRKAVDAYFKGLLTKPAYNIFPDGVISTTCYDRAMKQFTDRFGFSEYATRYYKIFINICNENPNAFGGGSLRE